MREGQLPRIKEAGDAKPFPCVYEEFGDRIFAFARRLTGNRQDAEDLMQETFVAAHTAWPKLRDHDRVLPWLLGIAIRRWRDRCRSRRYEDRLSEDVAANSGHEAASLLQVEMDRALATLPSDLRIAFLLVAVQGLTHREAAKVLRSPEGTVKWRVATATKRLRKVLDPKEETNVEGNNVS